MSLRLSKPWPKRQNGVSPRSAIPGRITFCPGESRITALKSWFAHEFVPEKPSRLFVSTAASNSTKSSPAASGEPTVSIDLRDPWLAAFLAWLVPGLGHMYQRRWGKGGLFMTCILATFFYGLWLGGGRVV